MYGHNSCKNNNSIYHFLYLFPFLLFTLLGILNTYEYISLYPFESNWVYGFIFLFVILFSCAMANLFFMSMKMTIEPYFWYISHVIAFMILTYISPNQWPFWVGILWEWLECYGPTCNLRISCSGLYDIMAGISTGLLFSLIL